MNILLVGGTFDENGGRPSKVVAEIFSGFCLGQLKSSGVPNIRVVNGGSLRTLTDLAYLENISVALWFANVSNEVEKSALQHFKGTNRHCLLVTSKRCVEKQYGLPDLIQRMLELHANLCVQFTKPGSTYFGEILDPLGNSFGKTSNMPSLGVAIHRRVAFMLSLTRIQSVNSDSAPFLVPDIPDEADFFKYVRESAMTFAKLIPSPTEVKRFVGNASFRCTRGFPSFRKDGKIYVSRRNVDKECIAREEFVPVCLKDGTLYFEGANKPSVDAPVHCLLYNLFPNINYMIHGHVYATDPSSTLVALPCGAIEEVAEIFHQVGDVSTTEFIVNLKGHGFIAGAAKQEDLPGDIFVARITNLPERQGW